MTTNQNIQRQILLLRSKMGWTQSQLAEKLGVSKQSVSNWETGLKTPRMGMIQKISKLFNVSLSQIMDNPDTAQTPIAEQISETVDQLNSSRQKNVLYFAKQQLVKQIDDDEVVMVAEPEAEYVKHRSSPLIAAHTDDNLTKEQQSEVNDFIAKIKREHEQ